MTRLNGPYLGDRKSMLVHDLNKAKLDCKIVEVTTQNKKYFVPDTLEQALHEGYKKCRCII